MAKPNTYAAVKARGAAAKGGKVPSSRAVKKTMAKNAAHTAAISGPKMAGNSGSPKLSIPKGETMRPIGGGAITKAVRQTPPPKTAAPRLAAPLRRGYSIPKQR